ncbi:MAG: hypothetical protein IH602_14650 [Bryobacteraceae bacterium]|jgi:hypothetical protein|nr:hypothetical protein [Bryobacteraceae bacterium]
MRKQLILAAAITAVFAIQVDAQGWGTGPRQGYGYNNNDRGRGYDNYGPQYRTGNPVTGAMRDLEVIFRRARVDNHEANHFRRALRELEDFDRHARRGRFDRGSLNSAIDNMDDLARAHQLHPRDRQMIARRIQELHHLRGRAGWR